jgi:hypothetical protein
LKLDARGAIAIDPGPLQLVGICLNRWVIRITALYNRGVHLRVHCIIQHLCLPVRTDFYNWC